ncbi:MAG: CHASE2 domain-containing protein [Proteobacteria bacterium]|nr:CHASE2 domain-containing protein [Pseudomonadota bacterium]MBU1714301.1 CHASE2 domain-containing protein [Pseudomonadota bacterium]
MTFIVLIGAIINFSPLNYLDRQIYDSAAKLRQHDRVNPIVIIEIDNKSIQEIGDWPWSRDYLAKLIEIISSQGVKATGIHLLFPNPENNPGLQEIDKIRSKLKREPDFSKNSAYDKIDKSLKQAEMRLDHDAMLLASITPVQNIVMPFLFSFEKTSLETQSTMPQWLEKHSIPEKYRIVSQFQLLLKFKNPITVLENTIPVARTIIPTYTKLASGAGAHGHINYMPDSDGIVRSHPLLISFQNRLFPSFALRLAMTYSGYNLQNLEEIKELGQTGTIQFKDYEIPVSSSYRMLIDFNVKREEINRYSFVDVIKNRIPAGVLKDKLVLIGLTAEKISPTRQSPVNTTISETEITANVIENILNNAYLVRPSWAWLLEIILILYFGLFLLIVTTKLSLRLGSLIMSIFLLTWYGVAGFLFINNGIWFKVAPHTILAVLGLLFVMVNKIMTAPTKKKDENTEVNKILGLSFQSQGLLDMAFNSFMKCSLVDPSVKETLYNLGLDFERKRMFNKAISVYEYILKGGHFKDSAVRIRRLKKADDNSLLGSNIGPRSEKNLMNSSTGTRPTLGRYEIIKEIGQGAVGTVYLGRDPKINRKVAIKTLRYDEVDPAQLAEIKERFFREAEAAGRLSHPNIVTIYDAGEDYDITYMAMELLDGFDLSRYCRKDNLLQPKMALNVIARVAYALDYAHKHHVVHRDIKPANIMLTGKGNIKVTDFGIARLTTASQTQTGVILGTPNYMSPEQVLGKKVDGRSDLFSLGAVFYELLSGEKPFKSDNIGALMHNISNAKYTPIIEIAPNTPPCCIEILDKLLNKVVTQRFQTAGAVVIATQKCIDEI